MAHGLRAIKRVRGTFKAIGVLAVILSVLTVCVFAGADAAMAAVGDAEYKVDTNTSGKYVDILGDAGTLSTRYAGRVWTDKSVSTTGVTFAGQGDDGEGEEEFSFNMPDGSDFLITYSAMATSQQIIELPQIPVDVVFILDFSASMTWGIDSTTVSNPDGSDSRIKAMVDSMNQTIAALAEANPENRIGIVVFNAHAQEMLPLTKLTEENLRDVRNGNYLSLNHFSGTQGQDNGESTVACNIADGKTIPTDSKTNIQDGLFEGMNMLAEAQDTTFVYKGDEKTYTRIPNVVLMSDGAPTTISLANDGYDAKREAEAGSWWQSLEDNDFWGDNNQAQSANGFMAMITAELLKNKIADHYEQNATQAQNLDELSTSMYTIGFGINRQNKSMVAMANMVLNPSYMFGLSDDDIRIWNLGNWPASGNADDDTGLEQVIEAREEWRNYADGRNASVHYVTTSNERNDPRSLQVGHPGQMSSASSWDHFGSAPTYVDEYYPADDAGALEDAFHEITNAIVDTAKVPTEIGNGNPVSSGYITYTDPIGDYMEVKGISGLLFGNTQFKVVEDWTETTSEGTRYYFSSNGDENGRVNVDSPIYSDQNINNIIITLKDDGDGTQTLTVQIPASLIPLRVNTVAVNADGETVESHTTNNVYPLRLVYGVGLKEGVVDAEGKLNEETVGEDYISTHTLDDGTVAFYSNLYDGSNRFDDNHTGGNATVTFTPANDNPFYFIQEETPLYTNPDATTRATGEIDPNGKYYFRISWYGESAVESAVISRPGSQLQGWTDSDSDGLFIREGAPRLGNLTDAVDAVAEGYVNETATATHPYYPTFEGNPHDQDSQFVVYLGNNGRLSVGLPGPDVLPALQVIKNDADNTSTMLDGAGFALYVDSNNNEVFDDPDDPNDSVGPDDPMVPDSSTKEAAEVVTTDGIASFGPEIYMFDLGTTYFLVEETAPEGYQLMDGAVKIVFSENDGSDENYPVDTYPFKAAIKFPGENEATVYCEELTAPGEGTKYQVATISVTVSDNALPNLPATGSNGRTALAATGVAAVTLGAYALWTRRRSFNQ